MKKTRIKAGLRTSLLGLCLVVIGTVMSSSATYAITSTVTLRPDGDSYSSGTTWTGVGGSGCSLLYCRIDEVTASTADYMNHASGSISTQYLTLTNPTYIGQGTTEFEVRAYAGSAAVEFFGTLDQFQIRAQYGMTAVNNGTDILLPAGAWRTNTFSSGSSSYPHQWFEQSQTGDWTLAQLTDAEIGFTRLLQNYGAQIQRLSTAEVVVTYTKPPLWNQTNYRIYNPSSTTTPGTPLAAENTMATLPSDGASFRIRMGLAAGETAWEAGFGTYKLQYALKTGTCAASTYSDVTASGNIHWKDDTPNDGAAIGSYVNDPSGTKTYQTYRETAASFSNANAVPLNNLALWDFSLQEGSVGGGDIYCFRMIKSDQVAGQESITYTRYPEVQVVGTLGLWFVNDAEAQISTPSIPFTSKYILTTQCQTSTSLTPAGGMHLRIENDLVTNGWSASIAPTGGPSAYWHDAGDTHRYDFNDPAGSPAGCFDGSDGDTYAGQLTINANNSYITRQQSGCGTTGLAAGSSNASFSEGVVDSITLFTASSASQRFCWWDIAGYDMIQTVPPGTSDGAYTTDMTLTVVAS